MRRLFFATGSLLAAALAAAPRPFNLDDLARQRRVGDAEISPDGSRVAYTVRTTDLKEDRHETHIWMTSWDGKTTVRLTTGKQSETNPRWSPDGRYLGFLSERDDENEVSQLWLLPSGGGEAEKITDVKGGVEDFDWAPDGKRLVLVVHDSDPPSAGKEAGKKSTPKKPIVIDRFQFKLDGYGYLDDRRNHLQTVDRETRKTEVLTSGDYDDLLPSWSPDGKTIAFVAKRGPDPDRHDNWDLYAIEPRAGAAPRQLTTFEGADNEPDWGESRLSWSPDSRWIAYVQGGPDKLIYYGLHRLAVVPAAGGPSRLVAPELDLNVLSPRFTPDGASLLFLLEEDQAVHLANIPVAGGPVSRVVDGRRVLSGFTTASDGRVAFLSSEPTVPEEVYAVDKSGPRRLSRQNDAWLAEVKLGAVEETRVTSKDGTQIHGFLVKPADYQPGRKYPAVLRIHGGPVGEFEDSFDDEWQWIAANGYVVIAANPRGSSGRGEKFQTAIYADWGHKDVEDVLAAVDDAVARGLADPDRLAVGGWSYGGMMTNFVIASTTRFKAATSGAGSSNALTGYGTDQYVREYEQELGTPWKNTDSYLKVSFPFLHADRITTPTLFLCGDEDFNVPLINSEQMYQALKSLGVPSELIIYPGQHHGIRKPSFQRDRLERYVAWYDRYAKASGGSAGSPAAAAGH
ncbi:MAG TPA: S9 family peptidase [Thermoanaerobaculia bacterium]